MGHSAEDCYLQAEAEYFNIGEQYLTDNDFKSLCDSEPIYFKGKKRNIEFIPYN